MNGQITVVGTVVGAPFVSFTIGVDEYASVTTQVEFQDSWAIGGRLGYLVNENALIYVLAGYSQASVDATVTLNYNELIDGAQTLTASFSDELDGYILGAGGELLVANGLALRLGYLYADYSGETLEASDSFYAGNGTTATYSNDANISLDVDAEIHSVRGSLVFKLGSL